MVGFQIPTVCHMIRRMPLDYLSQGYWFQAIAWNLKFMNKY